ncbi:hypothetical protein [Achromobacter sp. RTa]|nr:hypothetical protein [Achromobacter sp. RTa]
MAVVQAGSAGLPLLLPQLAQLGQSARTVKDYMNASAAGLAEGKGAGKRR